MSFKHSIIFLLVLILAVAVTGACAKGGSEKKPADQQTQATGGDQATTQTPPPAEGTEGTDQTQPFTTTNEEGVQTTVNPDGSVAVTDKDGVTRIYDKEGKVVATQNTGSAVASTSGTSTQPDATTTIKQPINSRGDVIIKDKVAIIKTNYGDVFVFFYADEAPTHVRNFIYLAEKGFYKDVRFHRIVPEFMSQAGIARPDWTEVVPEMPLEIKPNSDAIHRPGTLSAARTDKPNSATSQFFLVFTRERAQHLDGKYTVFGQMFKGFDVLDKLQKVKVGPNSDMGGREVSKPLEDVHIVDVVIEDAAKYKKEIDDWKAKNFGNASSTTTSQPKN